MYGLWFEKSLVELLKFAFIFAVICNDLSKYAKMNTNGNQVFDQMGFLEKTLITGSQKIDDVYSIGLLQPLLNGYPYLPFTGASLRPFCMVHILNDIVVNGRKNIIEFGSGLSTILMGRLIKKNNLSATVFSVEHNKEWVNVLDGILVSEGLSEIIDIALAPLKEWELFHSKYYWYDSELLADRINSKKFDMVIIDGPPAWERGKENARFPAVTFIKDKLKADHSIYLDDANRPGEKHILERWKQQYATDFTITGGTLAYYYSHNVFYAEPMKQY
jgi:predicted O-methyltransferase YrrM